MASRRFAPRARPRLGRAGACSETSAWARAKWLLPDGMTSSRAGRFEVSPLRAAKIRSMASSSADLPSCGPGDDLVEIDDDWQRTAVALFCDSARPVENIPDPVGHEWLEPPARRVGRRPPRQLHAYDRPVPAVVARVKTAGEVEHMRAMHCAPGYGLVAITGEIDHPGRR
jgi:hypothetical protein